MDAYLHDLTRADLDRWGYRLMATLVAAGVVMILLLAWGRPTWLLGAPVALVTPILVASLVRRPALHLCLILAGFVAISGHQPGLQVQEIVYGGYYLSYLGAWFAIRLARDPGALVRTPEDKAIAFLLVYATSSVGLTWLFGGPLSGFAGEWLSVSMLAFYFPVRELVREDRRAVYGILAVLAWFTLFGAARNLLYLREAMSSAEQMWQILRGRIKLNEIFFLIGSLGSAVYLLYARTFWRRFAAGALFAIAFASLLLTQSRGYWGAFVLGLIVIFLLVDRARKTYIVATAAVGTLGFVGVGLVFFPDYFNLILISLGERLGTIASAFTDDISLVNRIQETRALWEEIVRNPILGYGMGTQYRYFYLIPTARVTMEWSFVHNGYAGLWYKFGVLGLGSMAIFYLRGVWHAARLYVSEHGDRIATMIGLGVLAFLIGEMLVANTSNPFIISDGNLLIATSVALAVGCRERVTG